MSQGNANASAPSSPGHQSSTLWVIDADAHVREPLDLFSRYIEPAFRARAPRFVQDKRGHPWMGYQLAEETIGMDGTEPGRTPDAPPAQMEAPVRGSDPDSRIADMNAEGIDIALLYPSYALGLGYLRDPLLAAASYRAYNNWLSDYCAPYADRLIPIATLPLQDIEQAIIEARRVVTDLGMTGVMVRPNPIDGRRLDDRALDPLWAAIQDLGVPVGIHEGTTSTLATIGAERYKKEPYQLHVVSHVVEEMLACMDMIVGGVLDRFPSLKVLFLETGGSWICSWLHRLDHMVAKAGTWGPKLKLKPSEYFQRQCWISFDPDEPLLSETAEVLGADRVVWASDYPHFDGTFPGAAAQIRASLSKLPESAQRKVLAENIAGLYNLEPSRSFR
jgi:predicted TIM-barrel fold metal-dependent hydrolase